MIIKQSSWFTYGYIHKYSCCSLLTLNQYLRILYMIKTVWNFVRKCLIDIEIYLKIYLLFVFPEFQKGTWLPTLADSTLLYPGSPGIRLRYTYSIRLTFSHCTSNSFLISNWRYKRPNFSTWNYWLDYLRPVEFYSSSN